MAVSGDSFSNHESLLSNISSCSFGLVYKNDAHKPYPRGKNLSMATLAMHEDYGSYLPGIPDVAKHNVRHFDSRLGPFLSTSDMKRTVAFQQDLTDTEHKCAGLIRRFED